MISRPPRSTAVLGLPVLAALAVLVLAVWPVRDSEAAAPQLRLNQIQVIGSHNSYHFEPPQSEYGPISTIAGSMAQGLQYSHAPLEQQFAGQHVRQIELDLYADPDGGMYAKPAIRVLTGQKAEYDARMKEPGTKVLHIAGIDYHSNCLTLVECLKSVKRWSDGRPSHVPVAILLEFKDTLDIPVNGLPPIQLVTWTRERMLGVEQEILSVFPRERIVAPDDVRKPGKTLEESVLQDGWPLLDDVRGKVLFLQDNNATQRARYVEGNPSLEGRLIFTASAPGSPDAAFVQRNDASSASIPDLVAKGYVVRTRADADTAEARSGSTAPRDKALASGAQWVSTDYPVPGLAARFFSGYYAALPGFADVRCNPVSAPGACAVAD